MKTFKQARVYNRMPNGAKSFALMIDDKGDFVWSKGRQIFGYAPKFTQEQIDSVIKVNPNNAISLIDIEL